MHAFIILTSFIKLVSLLKLHPKDEVSSGELERSPPPPTTHTNTSPFSSLAMVHSSTNPQTHFLLFLCFFNHYYNGFCSPKLTTCISLHTHYLNQCIHLPAPTHSLFVFLPFYIQKSFSLVEASLCSYFSHQEGISIK